MKLIFFAILGVLLWSTGVHSQDGIDSDSQVNINPPPNVEAAEARRLVAEARANVNAYNARALQNSRQRRERIRELLAPLPNETEEQTATRAKRAFRTVELEQESKLNVGATLRRVPENQVPEEVLRRSNRSNERTTPFQVRLPPYDGWSWNWGRWISGSLNGRCSWSIYDPLGINYLDSGVGYIGGYGSFAHRDASDFDACSMGGNSNIGYWVYVPETGRFDIWLHVTSHRSVFGVQRSDEFGFSDAYTSFTDRITVSVGGTQASLITWYRGPFTGTSGQNGGEVFLPGFDAWYNFVGRSNLSPRWYWLQVGTQDEYYYWVNDVSISGSMASKWQVHQVSFRVFN